MAKAASRPAISDWGIPDPRDAVAYPVAATWPHWGWQFLRRRRDYRRRWEEVVRPYLTDDGGWDWRKKTATAMKRRSERTKSAAPSIGATRS